jgi:hypothetical protein
MLLRRLLLEPGLFALVESHLLKQSNLNFDLVIRTRTTFKCNQIGLICN